MKNGKVNLAIIRDSEVAEIIFHIELNRVAILLKFQKKLWYKLAKNYKNLNINNGYSLN